MSVYLRYVSTSEDCPTLPAMCTALQAINPAYVVTGIELDGTQADLLYGEMLLGTLEVNVPEDEIFEDDIAEMLELVRHSRSESKMQVMDILDRARSIVAVRAWWSGDDPEPVYEKIDPLWDYLFAHYAGVLQIDGDGFYDADGLLLDMRVTL